MELSKNTYSLPIKEKDLKAITSDPLTHVGTDRFAIDFVVSEGSVVKAAMSGKIIYVKVDSNSGGDEIKYENFEFYNHIVVKHENGEYTEYGHLKFNGSNKKVGDQVKEGDIIAYSGNTGFSEKPHLHFSVFVLKNVDLDFEKLPLEKDYFINDTDFGFETVKPNFKQGQIHTNPVQ